jgi:hypothetical protein
MDWWSNQCGINSQYIFFSSYTYSVSALGSAPSSSGQIGFIVNSPSSGWTQGTLNNSSQNFATLIIPVTGTWLISFSIVVSSVAISTGQFVMTNSAFTNIGLTNGTNQATFGGTLTQSNTLTFQGSLVVNNLSGTINSTVSFTGGNGISCLYAYSYLQATRIA